MINRRRGIILFNLFYKCLLNLIGVMRSIGVFKHLLKSMALFYIVDNLIIVDEDFYIGVYKSMPLIVLCYLPQYTY